MGKYKIGVYAIAKNEKAHVARWMASMGEADVISVLDTGSEDGTVEALRALGAVVTQKKIQPWRFDVARNASLDTLPDDVDICVCTDLDEVFEPSWRDKLEKAWRADTKRASYRYTWNFLPDGSEGTVFYIDKIHARQGFSWKHPVHEVLVYEGGDGYARVQVQGMQINHHADEGKSRAQYLPMLEMAVEEDPEDDRNMHYLGREYMYRGQWARAIATLTRHLALPKAIWADERCASMRYIARSYGALGAAEEQWRWLLRAIAEAPHLREPYMDAARLFYAQREWDGLLFMVRRALLIRQRPATYISEASAWGASPYDLAALGYYYTGRYAQAQGMAEEALRLSPGDERLQENLRWIREKLTNITAEA